MNSKLCLGLALGVSVAGCGGSDSSGGSGGPSANGRAKIVVHWPKTSTRLIPGQAKSIKVTILDTTSNKVIANPLVNPGTGQPLGDTIVNPGPGGTSAVETAPLLASHNYSVTADTYPVIDPDVQATVPPQAEGSTTLKVTAGKTVNFDISMASQLDHYQLSITDATGNVSRATVDLAGNITNTTGTLAFHANSALETVQIAPVHTSGSTANALWLFPTGSNATAVTSDTSLNLFNGFTAANTPNGGSVLSDIVAVNPTVATANLTIKYSENGNTTPVKIPVVPVTINPNQLTVPAGVANVLDAASLGGGNFLYLVFDGNATHVIPTLTTQMNNGNRVAAGANRLAAQSATTFWVADAGGNVTAYPGATALPTLTTNIFGFKLSGGSLYALTNDSAVRGDRQIVQFKGGAWTAFDNTANAKTAATFGIGTQNDQLNTAVSPAVPNGMSIYTATSKGALGLTDTLPNLADKTFTSSVVATAVDANQSGGLLFATNGTAVIIYSQQGKVVATVTLPSSVPAGITFTRLSVSAPDANGVVRGVLVGNAAAGANNTVVVTF